ncbi:MAG TPA: ribonuclease T2 [Rudaea sp.]|nr:ribonuclease T2 [Rudaea sp.]
MNHIVSRSMIALLVCALSTGVAVAHSHSHHKQKSSSHHFDYYLMSLSWSPSYCATHPHDAIQCGHPGFGFVLHGLWPENRNGSWPQHCDTHAAPDETTIKRTLAFMPSRRLIEHEWQTHGSCTGLDPSAYFAQADRAFASVRIPAVLHAPRKPPDLSANELIRAFLQTNPGLGKNMISVACRDGNELTEVRVCLNKDTLSPQACTGRIRNTCRIGSLRIRAVQ